MHLAFYAQEVYYAGAPDSCTINLSFQEYPDPDIDYSNKNYELPLSVKGIFFSANNDDSSYNVNVDWCDGEEESEGQSIKEIELNKTSLQITLKNNDSFDVDFEIDDLTFHNIKSFLIG